MPKKLQAVVALFVLSMGLDLWLVAAGNNGAWLGLVLTGLMLAGVLRGSDGMRTLLIALSWLSIVEGVAWPLMVLTAVRHLPPSSLIALLLSVCALRVATSTFIIYSLQQSDVRDWMFKRAFHITE